MHIYVRSSENTLQELKYRLTVEHLNDADRRPTGRSFEDCNDRFHSSRSKPTTTLTSKHAIPTPGIEPYRGIASINYKLLGALKGELDQITDKMLVVEIITQLAHSTHP
jgi:hypothetical protein